MVIPIKTDANITVDEIDITETGFKSLNFKKSHIEEFIRTNIELLLTDESLLIIGIQVTNSEKGRSDLTAIDENGNLVLTEIKRDVEDIKARKEELEFQQEVIKNLMVAMQDIFGNHLLKRLLSNHFIR